MVHPSKNRPPLRIKSVRVQNYKNIVDSGEVPLSEITALIGKNESGKTSFLEAIHSIAKSEKYERGEISNRVRIDENSETPIVTCTFEISKKAVENWARLPENDELDEDWPREITIVKFADGSLSAVSEEDKKYVSSLFENEEFGPENIKLTEEDIKSIEDIVNMIDEEGLQNLRAKKEHSHNSSNWSNLTKKVSSMKNQEYDFSDQAEREEFATDTFRLVALLEKFRNLPRFYQNATEELQKILFPSIISGSTVVFHEDYESIPDSIQLDDIDPEQDSLFLDLLDIAGIKIDQLVNSERDPTILLDEGGRRLKDQLNKVWSQKDIEIALRLNNNQIKLFIRDLSEGEDRGLTRPSERSTGFRWFLSLFITLLSESKSARTSPRVLLLDDPAVHLHPAGKRDWLDVLEQIAQDVQIVYTSHSPYLIRKRYPTRVRAFEDVATKGTQIRNEVFESDSDTLEPLRTALGVGLGDSPFISKRTVLVEGPADYYILTGVANYFEETLDRDIVNWGELSIMPVRGASEMPGKASWLESENIEYAILLDSDEEGRSVAERIDEHWPTIDSDRVVQLANSNADSDVVIEDMFSPELYIKHFNREFRQLSEQIEEDFEEVTIKQTNNAWEIEGFHYDGKRLDEVLKDVLEEQDIRNNSGEIHLRKRRIAQRLHNDLNDGTVHEEQLSEFNRLFADLKEITS